MADAHLTGTASGGIALGTAVAGGGDLDGDGLDDIVAAAWYANPRDGAAAYVYRGGRSGRIDSP